MVQDRFQNFGDSLMTPAERCYAITPNDVQELPLATKAVFIGQSGDVRLVSVQSTEAVTFRNLAAGSILDVRARLILATGTTATDLVGLA
jgi:hypothetical protein